MRKYAWAASIAVHGIIMMAAYGFTRDADTKEQFREMVQIPGMTVVFEDARREDPKNRQTSEPEPDIEELLPRSFPSIPSPPAPEFRSTRRTKSDIGHRIRIGERILADKTLRFVFDGLTPDESVSMHSNKILVTVAGVTYGTLLYSNGRLERVSCGKFIGKMYYVLGRVTSDGTLFPGNSRLMAEICSNLAPMQQASVSMMVLLSDTEIAAIRKPSNRQSDAKEVVVRYTRKGGKLEINCFSGESK